MRKYSFALRFVLLGTAMPLGLAMAQEYFCFNTSENVRVVVSLLNVKTARVAVKSPFQKQMACEVADFSNGGEIVKGSPVATTMDLPTLWQSTNVL